MAEPILPVFGTDTDLEQKVDRYLRRDVREDYFPLFLHFGKRALALCKDGGHREWGHHTVATWSSSPIKLDGGVSLTVEAVTSHFKVPANSDRGPLIKDTRIPRVTPRVFEIAVRSEVPSWEAQPGTYTEVSDRNHVETNIPSLQGDWVAAVEYVGACLDAAITLEMPGLLQEWHDQYST